MTEYLITPPTIELDDQEFVATEEVVNSLKENINGVITWWYDDGSFDYRPETDQDERNMKQVLDGLLEQGLEVEYRRH